MAAASNVTREFVLQLMKKKDEIEAEITVYKDVLRSQKDVGLNEALVDDMGYPRNDIDIYAVRIARNKVNCLQNDHKDIMIKIEDALHRLHMQDRQKSAVEDNETSSNLHKREAGPPFLKVDSVSSGSLAEEAGLQCGDLILEFGSVNSENFTGLQNVADVVKHSIGKTISIKVLRADTKLHLNLFQNHSSGQRQIGCKIVPL